MGGYITLRAMVVNPDIKAGVIWAGVVASYADMADVAGRPRFGTRNLLVFYGSPGMYPDVWASISANTYLADLSGPVQLHHGTADESVPTEFSVNLALEVREAGGVAELFVYDGDDHNISLNFTGALLRSIKFFDRYLKAEGE
ncbi:MAG: prolyl oligopeptidase family serine peptidase [Anaerolineales bacterium]